MRYLVDTSVFARLTKPPFAAAIGPLVAAAQAAMCAPVAFELGFSARNAADYSAVMDRVGAMPWLPTTDGDHHRAIALQRELASAGIHRSLSLVDALVAAIAESRDATVLHYDADFERIASITGQPHMWILARGSGD